MDTFVRKRLAHGFSSMFPKHAVWWEDLEELFELMVLEKDEPILRQGDYWQSVYFVETGVARLFYRHENGCEYNKDFFFEDNFFWPVAPSAYSEPSLFAISSLSSMRLWKAPYQRFRDVLQSHNAWESVALQLAEALAERKIKREAAFLLESPIDRYIGLFKEHSALINRIPDYHIASFLGVSQVHLSRIKRKLFQRNSNINTTVRQPKLEPSS